MSIVKSHRMETSKIGFSDVKSNDNNGKTVWLNYSGSPFSMQTPVMTLPYNMSVYDKGEYPKYTIELSFRDISECHRVEGFHKNMMELDNLLINTAVKQSMAWFKKKKTNKDVVSALFNPIIKKSKDKETGEYDGKYPDTIRLKLPFRDDKPDFEIKHLTTGEVLNTDPKDLFVKGARVQAIVRCGGVWIIGGKFGCTWKVEKIRVDAPKSIKDYSFIPDSDDEDASEPTPTKSSKEEKEDSDEEEDDTDDETDEDTDED